MRRWFLVGLFVLFFVFPFPVNSDPYWLSLLSKLFINAMLAISIWPLFIVGRLSIGHGAFYGMGAYGVSIIMLNLHWSFWVALPLTMIGVAIVAFAFGFPTLRIRGIHFAMATFAFNEVIRLIYNRFDRPFGGAQGLFNIPAASAISIPGLPELNFRSFVPVYYLILVSLVIMTVVYYRLIHSNVGLRLRSISDSPNLSRSLGTNVFGYEIGTFVLTAIGAAFAGGLYATYAHYIDPNLFGMGKSVDAMAYVVVGGPEFILGPLLGTIFLTMLPVYLNMARETAPLITGMLLILTMLLLKGGFMSFPREVKKLENRIRRWRQAPVTTEASGKPVRIASEPE